MASRGRGITSPGPSDKITIAIKNLKDVKVKSKWKEYQEIISKLERAIRENEVEDITDYIKKVESRFQALDMKDIAIVKAKKSIGEIRNKYVFAQPSIVKGERGLKPDGLKGKKIEAKERSTKRDELPWIAKIVGKFKKWLQEDIDILKDDFQDGCPDEMKEVQADLVYIRNEMSRRFEKIRNLGHDNTEKLRQLYASLQKPFDEQVKVKKNTTPSSDPDETVVTNIKNLFVDRLNKRTEDLEQDHTNKLKELYSSLQKLTDEQIKEQDDTSKSLGPDKVVVNDIKKLFIERLQTNTTAKEKAKKNEKQQKNISQDSNQKNESLEKEIELLSHQVENHSYDVSAFQKRSPKLDRKTKNEITYILETLQRRSEVSQVTLREIETLSNEVNGSKYDNTAFKQRTAKSDSQVIKEIQSIRERLESRMENDVPDMPEMLEELKHEVFEKTFKVDAFEKRYKGSTGKPVIATLLSIKQGCDQVFRNYETLQINCGKIAECILHNNFSKKPFQDTPDEGLEMIWAAVNKQQQKHESREFAESYNVHMAKIKPILSEMLRKESDCERDDVKNDLQSVQICLSEYRKTTKQLQEIDGSIIELVRFFEDNEKIEQNHTWSVTEATQRWKRDIPRCCRELGSVSSSLTNIRENMGIKSSGLVDICKQLQRRMDNLVDAGSIEQELKMMENKLVVEDFKNYLKDMKGRADFRSASRNSMIGNTGQQMLLQFIRILTNEIDAILHGQQEKIKSITEEKKSLFERLNEVKEKLTKDISTLEADKKKAILRLSKLASDKVTIGNPNIADLSDPNRPTKISECFSNLYDNEWTDAYESTSKTGKPDKDYCELLLNILKESDNFCRQQATAQRKMVLSALIIPSSLKSEKERDSRSVKTEEDIDKHMKEMRKSFLSQFVVNLKQVFKPYVKDELRGNKQIQDYAQKCVELCWYMCIQSPPVVIEISGKTGDKFDVEKYKYYTKKGNKVDFVVWPPLLLHEKGPILSKGVAQGK